MKRAAIPSWGGTLPKRSRRFGCRPIRWIARSPMRLNNTIAMQDRKSTRLHASHTDIYTLSLHDALPISKLGRHVAEEEQALRVSANTVDRTLADAIEQHYRNARSEEHTSARQSHRYLHSFPTRRSSDLQAGAARCRRGAGASGVGQYGGSHARRCD